MYVVIEVQATDATHVATLVNSYEDRNAAESKWHDILKYAAISSVPKHGAIIITDDCVPVLYKSYEHEVANG